MTALHELDTNARRPFNQSPPSEVWDEDFEFQQDDKNENMPSSSSRRRSDKARDNKEILQRSSVGENAFDKAGPSKRPANLDITTADHLRAWSESPISHKARGKLPINSEENWDDDFVDKVDSPVRASHRRSISAPLSQEENWDEDFEMDVGASPGSKRSRGDASWDSSDEEDMDRDLGFGRDEDDKTVTQRSRRRPLGNLNTDIPPVPPLPSYLPTIPSGALVSDPAPFPRSPTLSVFSIPTTVSGGRDSASGNYGSTLHLRRTHSAGSSSPSHSHHQHIVGRFPPVSPSSGTRERRRLRKKSRPPHLENNIIELDDRAELTPIADSPMGPYAHMPFRPVTPENRNRSSTPPPPFIAQTSAKALAHASSSSPKAPESASPAPIPPATSPPPKSPLFSRIGSVKRWSAGGRKKRASTGPSEVVAAGGPSSFAAIIEADRHDNNKTPRPHSSYIQTSSPAPAVPKNKFFRDVSGTFGTKEGQEQTPAKSRLSASSETSREREVKKGKSRLDLQGSSGGALETGLSSPRKLRIKAFGSKLIPSSSKSSSPERVEKNLDADGDTRMTPSPTPPPPPLPNDIPQTPSKMRPRLPPQTPSTLNANRPPTFPRHASTSAAHDSNMIAPSPSARSVSTSIVHEKGDLVGQTPEKREGNRGFMGSMRRISLVGGQKRHKRGKSGGVEDIMVDATPSPPVPGTLPIRLSVTRTRSNSPMESEPESSGRGLLPALELGPPLQASEIRKSETKATISPLSIDIGSPVEKSTLAPVARRPGEQTLSHSKSSSFATPPPSRPSQSVMARLNASPSQAASLGRASQNPTGTGGSASSNVHRRNSLGDLKIPSRISRAQDGLKRDLTRVREFATHVETMKDLRSNYYTLATQIQAMLEYPQQPSRATSPTTFFNFSRPVSRARSNTNPPPPPRIDYGLLALSFRTIDSKYRIAWECAELLIDLGTGATTGIPPDASPPSLPTSKSDPASVRGKNRERAITLAGDEGKPALAGIDPKMRDPFPATPPALLSWRASTGRHDLNQRQLFLLKEMLNNAESAKEGTALEIPEPGAFAPHWRLGEGMESNLTLPTEESASASNTSPQKQKRPSSKLGMTGIRDMLRSLKRNHSRANQPDAAQSSTTLSTESSMNTQARNYENHPYLSQAGLPMPPRSTGRRRSKTSAGPDSVRSTNGDFPHYPHMSGISISHKSSPRRPSLASLFRLGQKHKGSPVNSTDHSLVESANSSHSHGSGHSRNRTEDDDDESDWDRMDSLSDVDIQVDGMPENADQKGTLKLRKKKRLSYRFESPSRSRPTTFKNPFSSSQASLQGAPDPPSVQILSSRLSNVDENSASTPRSGRQTPADSGRPRSRGKDRPLSSSVRSVPFKPTNGLPVFDIAPIPEFKLAMTPENIRPLLENARVVTARLQDCVSEVKDLLSKAEVPS